MKNSNNANFLILRRTLFLKFLLFILFFGLLSSAPAQAEGILDKKITLVVQQKEVRSILNEISKLVEVKFVYSAQKIPAHKKISFQAIDQKVKEILDQLLGPLNVLYYVSGNQVVLMQRGEEDDLLLKLKSITDDRQAITKDLFYKAITGKITNAGGQPLQGVSVSVKGTSRGTVTNAQGVFTIDAEEGETLEFSILGYVSATVRIGQGNSVAIQLQPAEVTTIDEVVVTALGIKKESRKLGYAATTVKVDDITQNRTTNVMKSLEGKVAGLEIAPPTAGANASTRIRLRGQAGFNGQTNSPLIVINGLPMDQGARSAEGGGPATDQGDNLSSINQDDIESMTVLKGATAAALYGSRASNGAIIITTKSGSKNSKFGVEISSSFAADDILDYTDYQTEYGTGSNGVRPSSQAQAQSFGNLAWGEKYDGVPTFQYDGVQRPYLPSKNRMKEFYNTGTSYVNTLALSGGNAATSYRVSFSNLDAKGISPGNSYHKKIFNLGLNSKVTNKLTLQVNINYTHEENNNPPLVGAQGIGFSSFLNRIPLTVAISTLKTSIENPDGSILSTNPFNNLLTNPYYLIGRMFDKTKRDRFLGTVSLRYDFTKWLYLQGRVNADFGYNNNEANNPSNYAPNAPINSATGGWAGSYGVSTGFNKQMNSDFLLGTTKKIGDFTIDASVGGNMFTVNNNFSSQTVTDFVVRNVYSIANGITKTQNYNISRSQVNSIYAFADFSYKNFLYLNITDRSDYFSVLTPPSSIVADPKNSFNYPSVSASFIFSELLPNIKWLNYGKLRMSYAKVGNVNGISPYSSQLTYSIESQLFGGYSVANIAGGGNNPNPYIIPYSVSEKEIGLELRTLNSRLNFDIAVYDKRTNDQILPINLSASSGYTGQNVNIAKLKNTGAEVLVDGTPVRTSNFSWNVSVNGTYNISKVLALNPGQTRQVVTFFNGTGNEFIGYLTYDVGKEMNQLVDYTYLRNDKGQVMLNSSGNLIHSTDFVNYGSANYKWIGGITNTFSYKSLSLLIQVDGKFGGKVFSSTALNGLRSGIGKNSLVGRGGVVFDGVLPNGTQNTISVAPQTFYANYRSQNIGDPFVFSSDFIKLRNITLTYDLTNFIGKKVKFVKGLTLSAFCRNAALLMKHIPTVDPEAFASSSDSRLGYEQHTEPTTRTLGLNLNVKF